MEVTQYGIIGGIVAIILALVKRKDLATLLPKSRHRKIIEILEGQLHKQEQRNLELEKKLEEAQREHKEFLNTYGIRSRGKNAKN